MEISKQFYGPDGKQRTAYAKDFQPNLSDVLQGKILLGGLGQLCVQGFKVLLGLPSDAFGVGFFFVLVVAVVLPLFSAANLQIHR